MLEPKYNVIVKVWDNVLYRIDIEFGRPIDSDVLKDLKELENYNGFVVQVTLNGNIKINIPLTYDIFDVAKEIEYILENHNIDKIQFFVYSIKLTLNTDNLYIQFDTLKNFVI